MLNFSIESVWSWGSFVGRLLMIDLISTSSQFTLVGCVFPELYPFLLGYPICWHTVVHYSLISLFNFSLISDLCWLSYSGSAFIKFVYFFYISIYFYSSFFFFLLITGFSSFFVFFPCSLMCKIRLLIWSLFFLVFF